MALHPTSMPCPKCEGRALVKETAHSIDRKVIRRKRKCEDCGHELWTIEYILAVKEAPNLMVGFEKIERR